MLPNLGWTEAETPSPSRSLKLTGHGRETAFLSRWLLSKQTRDGGPFPKDCLSPRSWDALPRAEAPPAPAPCICVCLMSVPRAVTPHWCWSDHSRGSVFFYFPKESAFDFWVLMFTRLQDWERRRLGRPLDCPGGTGRKRQPGQATFLRCRGWACWEQCSFQGSYAALRSFLFLFSKM